MNLNESFRYCNYITSLMDQLRLLLSREDFEELLTCGYVKENHQKLPVDRDNDFETEYFLDLGLPREKLIPQVEAMLRDPSCGNVFRVKGFCRDAAGAWTEVNITRHNRDIRPVKEGQDVVIVIGEGLRKEAIETYLF